MATTATSQGRDVASTRRFGVPQAIAAGLLLAFVIQGLWLMSHSALGGTELLYSRRGDAGTGALPTVDSPLTVLAAHAAKWFFRPSTPDAWQVRLPSLLFGVLLGASLWYVARRLYGNAGGYVALLLYTFSPTMITYAARVQPEMPAAWGVFGTVFTGIAVAHTLYAPREVVLWNWKRIVLLGAAIGVGAGAQFSTVLAVLIGLAFMLYLVPKRRGAAIIIMVAASLVGTVVFWGLHRFEAGTMAEHASRSGLTAFVPRMLFSLQVWRMIGRMLVHNGPAFVLLLIVALATFVLWRHTRFFGTYAPLLGAFVLIVFGLAFPHAAGFSFLVIALPFLFVFIAGVAADLLQSRMGSWALGIIGAALVMHAYFSVGGLWQLSKMR